MSKQPYVAIIILNWNGWQDTIECVKSCQQLDYNNCQIIIVDNHSQNNSEQILREHFPDTKIIQSGNNLGFAGGNNVGIRYAQEQKVDYIWLLNNDTIITDDSLTELVKVAENNKKAAIVGSKIFFYDPPQQIWFAGGKLNYYTGYGSHIGYNCGDQNSFSEIGEVDFITGCSLLIKSQTIADIGLMDDRYFLYFEDVEWCLRAKRQGYQIFYAPGSKVWHKISQSTGQNSPRYYYYMFRNSLLCITKHRSRLYLFSLTRKFAEVFYLYYQGNYKIATAALRGICDFLRGRSGKGF